MANPSVGTIVCLQFDPLDSGITANMFLDGTGGATRTVSFPFPPNTGSRWMVESCGDPDSVALRCLSGGTNVYLDLWAPHFLSPDKSEEGSWFQFDFAPEGGANDIVLSVPNGPNRLYLGVVLAGDGAPHLTDQTSPLPYYGPDGQLGQACNIYGEITGQGAYAGYMVTLQPYFPDGSGNGFYANGNPDGSLSLLNAALTGQYWTIGAIGDQTVSLFCQGIDSPAATPYLQGNGGGAVGMAGNTGNAGAHWTMQQNPDTPWSGNNGIYRFVSQVAGGAQYLAPPAGDPPPNGGRLWLDTQPHDWIVTIQTAVFVVGPIASYTAPDVELIIWRGTDGHVYQYQYNHPTSGWAKHDLTNWGNGPVSPPGDFVCLGTPVQQIYYTTPDGILNCLNYTESNTWQNGVARNTPTTLGSALTGFSPDGGSSVGLCYIGANGHVYLFWTQTNTSLDLTAAGPPFVAPATGSSLAGAWISGHPVVAYVGTDGDLYQIINTDGDWNVDLLANDAAGGTALAACSNADGNEALFYVGSNGHIMEVIYVGPGNFYKSDLTSASGAGINARSGTALTGYSRTDNRNYAVAYIATDGDLHQLAFIDDRAWADHNLTRTSGAAVQPAPGTPMTSYSGTEDSRYEMIVYVGTDMHIHQLLFNGSSWSDTDLTARLG